MKKIQKAFNKTEKRLAKFVGRKKYYFLDLLFPEMEDFILEKLTYLDPEENEPLYYKERKQLIEKFIEEHKEETELLISDIKGYFKNANIDLELDRPLEWFIEEETELGDVIDIIVEELEEKQLL